MLFKIISNKYMVYIRQNLHANFLSNQADKTVTSVQIKSHLSISVVCIARLQWINMFLHKNNIIRIQQPF